MLAVPGNRRGMQDSLLAGSTNDDDRRRLVRLDQFDGQCVNGGDLARNQGG
jgi:hypothetical protein